MTSSAPAAFSSRIVTVRASRVWTIRLPATSSRSSRYGGRSVDRLGGQERPRGRVVLARRGHGDQLALRPAQRGQPAAEHAAGVDVDRVVEPLGLGDRRVAVDDGRAARGSPPPRRRGPAARTRRSPPSSRRRARTRARGASRGPGSARASRRGRRRAARRRARRGGPARAGTRATAAANSSGSAASCSSDSASPWVICTSRPAELAHELDVVVAGHADRVPATSPITSRSTSGTPRPAIHESPTNTSRRPSGCTPST